MCILTFGLGCGPQMVSWSWGHVCKTIVGVFCSDLLDGILDNFLIALFDTIKQFFNVYFLREI